MSKKCKRGVGPERLTGSEREKASEMRKPKRVTVLPSVQYQLSEQGSLKGTKL
jgi:hypothetical protein